MEHRYRAEHEREKFTQGKRELLFRSARMDRTDNVPARDGNLRAGGEADDDQRSASPRLGDRRHRRSRSSSRGERNTSCSASSASSCRGSVACLQRRRIPPRRRTARRQTARCEAMPHPIHPFFISSLGSLRGPCDGKPRGTNPIHGESLRLKAAHRKEISSLNGIWPTTQEWRGLRPMVEINLTRPQELINVSEQGKKRQGAPDQAFQRIRRYPSRLPLAVQPWLITCFAARRSPYCRRGRSRMPP